MAKRRARAAGSGDGAAGRCLDVEVSLEEIRPRIWRRFLLRADATFEDLHEAIQDAFGWTNSHLWEFCEAGRRGAAIAVPELPEGADPWREDDVPAAPQLAVRPWFERRGTDRCVYVYDFGDHWVHAVRLRGVVEGPEGLVRKLLGGARAGPPEDCGSVPGYETCCAFVATGRHPDLDADEFREWLGDWHPEAFLVTRAALDFDRPPPKG